VLGISLTGQLASRSPRSRNLGGAPRQHGSGRMGRHLVVRPASWIENTLSAAAMRRVPGKEAHDVPIADLHV